MPWQKRMFVGDARHAVASKGRQVGATEVAAALAVHVALSRPGSTCAIISPSQRQSSEVTVRARVAFWRLGETLRQDSATLLRTANGSRVLSPAGSARGIRGYAADLVVLDEASWIAAETFAAARPLTAATNGRLIVQSTPGSPVGPFYEMVAKPPEAWAFLRVRSDEVPTISAEFLERERREMQRDLYRQEYEAEFGSTPEACSAWRTSNRCSRRRMKITAFASRLRPDARPGSVHHAAVVRGSGGAVVTLVRSAEGTTTITGIERFGLDDRARRRPPAAAQGSRPRVLRSWSMPRASAMPSGSSSTALESADGGCTRSTASSARS